MSFGGFVIMDPSPEKTAARPPRGSSSKSTSYFEISPVQKQKLKKVVEEIPVLRLIHFTHSPKITFDSVKLGTTCHRKLRVLNPKDETQEVFCEKFPKPESGISCSDVNLVLQPGESAELILTWTPVQEGNFRDLIHWKSNLGVRSQTVLLGSCVDPSTKKKGKVRSRAPLKPQNVAPVYSTSKRLLPCKASRTDQGLRRTAREKVDVENKPPVRPKCKSTTRQGSVFKKDQVTCPKKSASKREVDSKSLRRVVLSTSSQESIDILPVLNSTENSDALVECTPCGPSNLSVSAIDSECPSSLRKIQVETMQHHKKVNSVMWKDISDDEKNLHTRRMTYCLPGDDVVVEVREVIDEVTEISVLQQERFDIIYDVTRKMEQSEKNEVSSEPVQQTKTLVSTQEIRETSSTHSEEVQRESNILPATLEHPSSHRKLTFAHRGLSSLQEDLNEGDVLLDAEKCGSLSDKETFTQVIGEHLPHVTVSPLRRETFIASKKEDFSAVKGDNLPNCNEMNTPLRRQTFITSSVETFSSAYAGQLPVCNILDSPLRRQTFVKDQAEIRRLSLFPKAGQQPEECDDEHSCINSKWKENSCSSNTSTPTVGITPLRSASLDVFQMTPITPGPQVGSNNFASIKASCMNLLEKLKAPENFPETPNLNVNMLKRESYRKGEDTLDASHIGMCTAPESPSSEYETAPSTPSEPALIMEDFNVSLEFPTPKIGDHVPRVKNVNLTDVSQILEQELASQRKKVLENSMSPDSLEKTFNDKEEMNDPLEELIPTVCKKQSSETDTHTIPVKHSDIMVTVTKEDDFNCQGSSLQRRLSSETVIKEASILHPEDLVLDDHHNSCETIVKDVPTFSPSSLPQVTDTHRPRRMSAIGVAEGLAIPKHSNHRRRSEPLSLLPQPYQSEALNELLLFKGANKKEREYMQDERDLLSDENFVVASLADFSFSPGDDPRRCSTSIKSLPPEELLDQRSHSDKGRQLFVESDCEEEEPSKPACLNSDVSDVCLAQCLSTIMEVEEGTFYLNKTNDFNKTQDVLLNKTRDLSKSSLPMNVTHILHLNKKQDLCINNTRGSPVKSNRVVIGNKPKDLHLKNMQELPMDRILSRTQELPLNRTQELPLNRTQELPLNRTQELPLNRTQELPLNRTQELPLNRTQELPLNRTQEL
ncbi:hypothetical protein OTU49_006767, partial [Cherax quadricarinatus]